jgi:hypothetical protein
MHLNATQDVMSWLPVPVQPNRRPVNDANGLDVGSMIGEFGSVMEDQNRRVSGGASLARRLKVPGKNLRFGDAVVGEKTISGFGVGPVLASQRNALANAIGEPLEKLSEALAESDIAELAADKFTIDPGLGLGGVGVINPQ